VFLGFMVLLLEKTLPLVFIPDPIRLWLVRGHIVVLGQSAQPRKSFCGAAPLVSADSSSRLDVAAPDRTCYLGRRGRMFRANRLLLIRREKCCLQGVELSLPNLFSR